MEKEKWSEIFGFIVTFFGFVLFGAEIWEALFVVCVLKSLKDIRDK